MWVLGFAPVSSGAKTFDRSPLIPLERFFANPVKLGAQLSPDGTRLSYLAPVGGQLNIFVRTIGKNDDRAITHDRRQRIFNYFWSRDGKRILYLQDKAGNENTHLYAVDTNNRNAQAVDLTPFDKVRVDEIIALPRDAPAEILLTLNKRDSQVFDVYNLNLYTGELWLVAENPGNIGWWLADSKGNLNAAVTIPSDGGREILTRETQSAPWRVVAKYTNEDSFSPIRLAANGQSLYARSAKDSDKRRLVSVNLSDGAERTIDQDSEVDLNDCIFSEKTGELLGTTYIRDRTIYRAFDPRFKKDIALLKKIHPGDFRIASMDADERRWIVIYTSDIEADVTYLYNRTTEKTQFLFTPFPWTRSVKLAPVKPISLTSPDGLALHGYLTLPIGRNPKNLPMILKVHGGPWGERDRWAYDQEVQFLANRGYAVLQINYRGTTGYGKKFARAAIHEFAGKMHDDLIDGVNWAVKRGIADPKRVAIYGGSYGGYATLVGLTFTPDFFACGISLNGMSNLVTLIKSFPVYWKPFLWMDDWLDLPGLSCYHYCCCCHGTSG